MRRLAVKCAQGTLTVLVLVLAVFVMIRLLPGDPARAVAGELASQEDVERIRIQMGLDQSLPVQVGLFLRRLTAGDLGKSLRTHMSVWDEIASRAVRTLLLAGSSLSLALLLGIVLAIIAAGSPGSLTDTTIGLISVLGYGTPLFWVALVLIDIFAVRLSVLPAGGQDSWQHLLLPMSVLAFSLMGSIAQLTRDSLAEVLNQDYVRMARAKGVPEWRVISVHALRNAALPVLAYLGTQIGLLFGGAAITETVFAWHGLGLLVVTAALSRDYPLLQGLLLVIGLGFVFLNSILEYIYECFDPRLRP